ncbi:MAG: DoxX family protein [Thermoanaerobaculia bacterium]
MFRRLTATDASWATRIASLTLGIVFFPHGAQKMLGWFGGPGFAGEMELLTGIGIPAFFAFLVILGEFFGALGLIVGFLSRAAAAGIAVIMAGAVFIAHLQHGFFMNWSGQQPGEGFEYHLLALALCAVVMIRGSGAGSVDRALAARG